LEQEAKMDIQISEHKASIKLSKTSTGKYSWDIKKYAEDNKLQTMQDVINDIAVLDGEMAIRFPDKPQPAKQKSKEKSP